MFSHIESSCMFLMFMAAGKKRLFLCFFVLFLLLHLQVIAEANQEYDVDGSDLAGNASSLYKLSHRRPKINCNYACAMRCRKASRKNVCERACGTCCLRCSCVPPGTYGNKNACPCYAGLRTHGRKPKCP
ncbi:hypothetical protein IEQ34_011331 [Dendrobium chrysotoxum]|nr:hypothetical protein IEQ34_011331 [Dendrobium chrysotoxum]